MLAHVTQPDASGCKIVEVAGPKGAYVVGANERQDVNQWVDAECPGLEEAVWSDFWIPTANGL